jgi:hypothetical protein
MIGGAGLFTASVVVLLLTSGCEHRCWEAMDPVGRYSVDIVDLYSPGSRFQFAEGQGDSYFDSSGSCAVIDGLSPGVSLQVQGTGEANDANHTCFIVTANLTSAPAAVVLGGPSVDAGALQQARGRPGFMYGVEDVTVGGCAGTLTIKLFHVGAGNLYSTPADGQLPAVVLYRLFLPTSGACLPCDDNFVVRVSNVS